MDVDELAYDGSNKPQSRELTARERDILTRILNDILHVLRKTRSLDSLNFMDGQGFIRMGLEEVPKLVEIRRVIDPRED